MSTRRASRIPTHRPAHDQLRRPARAVVGRLARILAAVLPLCLSACIIGGTGTDTENGIVARVTDGAGNPLSGVALGLFDPAYRPDSGQPPEAVVENQAGSLVSDADGYVRLKPKLAGKFVVEGVSQGKTLFFDTLAVADPRQAAAYTFRAHASLAFRGKVTLASGLRIDSGRVFIRGTGRMAKVDSAGGYDLGMLPADAARMALGARFVSSPVTVLRAAPGPLSVTDTAKRPTYSCQTLSGDSASKAVTPAISGTQTETPSKLDTSVVNPALQSCGSLREGTVINVTPVRSPSGTFPVSQETSVLVLKGASATTDSTGSARPVVAPLSQCVPALGKETTVFSVDVIASGTSADWVVEDRAPSCQVP